MRGAFTLIELLVVMGIMGLLGTISVGGYRAMQRGMEERGVMQNVNTFVKAAYERAQIDRQPTAIFFWNETIREASEDENIIVVGHAVAVRRQGRVSCVESDGCLVDEFADLDKTYPTEDEEGSEGAAGDRANTMYLYNLDDEGGKTLQLKRSVVGSRVERHAVTELYLQVGGLPGGGGTGDNGEIVSHAFKMVDANGVNWKVGSSYGLEFAELTLPRNYIFGSSYSETIGQPVKDAGTMMFTVGRNAGNGAEGGSSDSVTVYSFRPDGSGGLRAEKVATNDKPDR